MGIEINQEVLDEATIIVNTKLVNWLNETGCSFPTMAFILQSVINAIDDAQDRLDNDEN